MVTIIHGSSHFKPMGQTAITGPKGFTGPTGPTGPTGEGELGQIGWSGGNITNMYLIGDKLHTIFAILDSDGVHRGQTAGYTTTTRIKGQTGDTYNLIDGGNTFGGIGIGGATFAKGRNSSGELNSLVIKSIEVTGGSTISLTQREDLDTINIHFDRGNFGYLDIGPGSSQNQLVGTDSNASNPLWFVGVIGATYDIGTSRGLENGAYAIDTRVQDYKEKIKYLTVGAAGSGSDLENLNENPAGQDPIYAPPTDTPIDPNKAKVLVLDMRQFENVESDGYTGGVQLRFRDAHFGYTGNESNSNKNLGKAFTLITHGATVGYESSRFDGNNIIWPLDLEPCWSGETDIINFFWLPCERRELGDLGVICPSFAAWHGNIVQWKSQGTDIVSGTNEDPFFCHSGTSNYTNDFRNYNSGMTGTTGACCVGGGICVHTMSNLCHGHYFGAGTTCGAGGSGSVCYEPGACCISNTQINNTTCYEDIFANECVELGNKLNYISSFGGTGSECADMNCRGGQSKGQNKRGACCDGLGRCLSLTEEECRKRKYYFAGVGVSCRSSSKSISNICVGGTGACILSDTVCEDGWSGGACIDGGYLYAGNNSKCGDVKDIRKSSSTSGCIPEVSGLNLKPGDLYAGGMVVGLYRPHGSSIRGAKSFGGNKETSWQELMKGSTGSTGNLGYPLDKYKSKYDYHGYGFDSAGCQDYNKMSTLDTIARPDAYYIIVSMHHLGITGDREIINPDGVSGVTSDFFWGNRGSAWGPLYDQRTGKYDEITDNYNEKVFYTSEGYWYNQEHGDMSLGVLGENTFSSCKKARRLGNGAIQKLETKSIQSAHGLWHRNWGMYNNIRVISADNALHRNYNDNDGTYSGSDFGPGLTGSYVSSFRAARLFSDNLISATGATGPINNKVSSWYIPSHDEMAYIASNCIGDYSGFNLNAKLLEEDGVPIEGWHWTSTGAFNEVKGMTLGIGEGIINPVGATGPAGVTADPGTLAWAMKFDVNGYWANFKVGKKNRTHNRYRVRPIRLIRCDGKFADGEDENYKLWKLPNVLRDEDKGINQRH